MTSNDTTQIALKSVALGSTIWLASSMASASTIFIPSLLRPLTHKAFSRSGPNDIIATPAPSRPASTLSIPTIAGNNGTDGRLTPQPSDASNPFAAAAAGSNPDGHPRLHAYQSVARQFGRVEVLFRAQAIPLELAAIGAFGTLAFRARSAAPLLRNLWAAGAGIVVAVFPFTAVLIAPLIHKLRRLAGEEEKVEPYEDAPPDREAERSNTVDFLQQWGALNAVRLVGVLAAAGLGLSATLLE